MQCRAESPMGRWIAGGLSSSLNQIKRYFVEALTEALPRPAEQSQEQSNSLKNQRVKEVSEKGGQCTGHILHNDSL